jgi:hypothetical protein
LKAVHEVFTFVELGKEHRKIVGNMGLAEYVVAKIDHVFIIFRFGFFIVDRHG